MTSRAHSVRVPGSIRLVIRKTKTRRTSKPTAPEKPTALGSVPGKENPAGRSGGNAGRSLAARRHETPAPPHGSLGWEKNPGGLLRLIRNPTPLETSAGPPRGFRASALQPFLRLPRLSHTPRGGPAPQSGKTRGPLTLCRPGRLRRHHPPAPLSLLGSSPRAHMLFYHFRLATLASPGRRVERGGRVRRGWFLYVSYFGIFYKRFL